MTTVGKRAFWFDDNKQPNVADILEREPGFAVDRLKFHSPDADNWPAIERAHAYCISSARDEVPDQYKCSAAFIARCPELLVVSTTGAGYDTVDLGACSAAGVLAVNQAGANADAVAEHAVAMMLSLSKNIPQTDRSLRRERGVNREVFKGWNAHGRTVGILGLGQVGRRVARICSKGLQMRVIACDPYLTAEECAARDAMKVDFVSLISASRYLTIHCPLTDETRGIIGVSQLAKMQAGAYLINTARGGIVDESALAEGLTNKHLAGAGIDAWDIEPPPLQHPLLAMDNVIATYHTAGVTVDSRHNMANWNAEQIVQILDGQRPPRLLNSDAWPLFARRFEQIFGARPAS